MTFMKYTARSAATGRRSAATASSAALTAPLRHALSGPLFRSSAPLFKPWRSRRRRAAGQTNPGDLDERAETSALRAADLRSLFHVLPHARGAGPTRCRSRRDARPDCLPRTCGRPRRAAETSKGEHTLHTSPRNLQYHLMSIAVLTGGCRTTRRSAAGAIPGDSGAAPAGWAGLLGLRAT